MDDITALSLLAVLSILNLLTVSAAAFTLMWHVVRGEEKDPPP